MKYYPYYVKAILTEHFGANPLLAMRRPHSVSFDEPDRKNLIPLSWQYADNETLSLFLNSRFLIETRLEEDCLAYLYQQGDVKGVLLMFMFFEEDAPFSLSADYASQLSAKWESLGYQVRFASQCIAIDNYGRHNGFHFVQHLVLGLGTSVYKLEEAGESPVLTLDMHTCWPIYMEKMRQATASNDIREYQCLFDSAVSISIRKQDKEHNVAIGIHEAMDFFRKHGPVRLCYSEFENSGVYQKVLLLGEKELNFSVGRNNLIVGIVLSDWKTARTIECPCSVITDPLTTRVPTLCAVRALSVSQIHGYAVQLTYADGSIRNYYLKMAEDIQLPDTIDIDGYTFDERILRSAAIRNNGLCFENGYAEEAHFLFYRSIRQACPVFPKQNCSDSVLEFKYLLPLSDSKSAVAAQPYRGTSEECFGPAKAFLNGDGRRITDASFYFMPDSFHGEKAVEVCLEPTGRYGLLQKNGTWLAPPIYTCIEQMGDGCAKAVRTVCGEPQRFLITPEGKEIPFVWNEYSYFSGGLCPFNAASKPVSAPPPGYYWVNDYENVTPGLWGYMDNQGKIAILPQYVYALDFSGMEEEHAIVAKLSGEKLLWGVIDKSGREIVPCLYESIYTRWGDALAFRREGETLYGIMDFNGNMIVQPRFADFEAYNEAHRVLTVCVGEEESRWGVYSLDRQAMIIPAQFDCITYDAHIICCEYGDALENQYFDYDGNQLDFSDYDNVHECNEMGLLQVSKGEKYGFVKPDGTVVIPPILADCDERASLSLYEKGYILTGVRGQYGLATVDEREILPQRYSAIRTYDAFVAADESTSNNQCLRSYLFSYDGTPLLQDICRNIVFDGRKKLTVETPEGTKCFELTAE